MNGNIYRAARNAFAKMKPATYEQHQVAWASSETLVKSKFTKRAKVFEVHHAVEKARELYFDSVGKGLTPDQCGAAVSEFAAKLNA